MCGKRGERFYAHQDSNNLPGGYSVLSAIDCGTYHGCYLVFPRWRIACDLRSRDVLIVDNAELHANTPIIGQPGSYERLSVVAYYRAGLQGSDHVIAADAQQ